VPRSGDPGQAALPHAWRAQHRAAHRSGDGAAARGPHRAGAYSAETRAFNRYALTMLRRGRVGNDALRYCDRLPAELAARLAQMPPELMPPRYPSGGLTVAQDREVLRAEAEALAPWKAAIAWAKAHAPVRAAREDSRGWPACAGHDVGVERGAGAGCDAGVGREAGEAGTDCGAGPYAPVRAQAAASNIQAKPHAPVRAPADLGASGKAHAPERSVAEGDAILAALPNRAERRRWKSLQKRMQRTVATHPRP
jgi:hypothetical protein